MVIHRVQNMRDKLLSKRSLILSFLIFITYFVFISNAEIEQLTFCGPTSSNNPSRSLIFVSTLDGKVSALDAAHQGTKQWTVDFNEGPMLSSNIHRRELNNNGQWIRLIPSLNGGLYKFDGENLEAIPVTTEQLLQSSFRYSDDLVFSGGKEIRSYGISSITGQILYECNINGCTNKTEEESYIEQEVLIIQRFQQTVRAIEPRTGLERWNFSTGQHDLKLIPNLDLNCHDKVTRNSAKSTVDIELKVIVPEGLIWAVNKSNPDVKLWQYKFNSPIVTIWQEDKTGSSDGQRGLKEVNLFDNTQWTWGSNFATSPSIYLGMHRKQLYIQENKVFYKMLERNSLKTLQDKTKFPWQPYPAISTAVAESMKSAVQDENNNKVLFEPHEAQSTTALSVLYNSEYINGNGFYLYTKEQLYLNDTEQCNTSDSDYIVVSNTKKPSFTDYINEDDDTPVQVIIVSLWYWWKEVLVISITTAILLNFMLTQRLLNATTDARDAVISPLIVEKHVEVKGENCKILCETVNNLEFISRYLTDFEPIDCLGKGGYGIVFEAKNKIDDCNYAIKRIALPNSQDSRERVMREVKALAKLDHHNIVRYFNAWLECPPKGWQEEHDQLWIDKQKFPSSEFPSDLSHITTTKPSDSICIDVYQNDQPSIDSAVEACELDYLNKDDDSFIVFESSNMDETNENESVININSKSCTRRSNSSISNDTAKTESSVKSNTNRSESIVFQDSTDTEPENNERSRNDEKSSLNLNLNKGSKSQKSTKMFLYIQMQLCQRLSLREWLKQQTTPRDSQRIMNIFQQIVDAVEYVHLQGLIHRDLKPSNIFFAYDEKIKIGDFGLVTAMTEGYEETCTSGNQSDVTNLKNSLHTACVGTHLYMSPEQMNGQVYNYKVDIYSLGIILFELLIPFSTAMERISVLMDLRRSVFPTNFAVDYSAEYDLLRMMLDENPDKRPTTLGIKARPPLSNLKTANELGVNEDTKWHFELPQLSRHSSVTNSNSNSESWENIS